ADAVFMQCFLHPKTGERERNMLGNNLCHPGVVMTRAFIQVLWFSGVFGNDEHPCCFTLHTQWHAHGRPELAVFQMPAHKLVRCSDPMYLAAAQSPAILDGECRLFRSIWSPGDYCFHHSDLFVHYKHVP